MRRIITTVAKPASSKISSKSTQKGIPRNGGRRLRSRRRMRMREKKMNPVRTKQRQETAFLGFARSGAILGFRVCSFRNQLRFRVFRFLANARQSLKAHQHHHHHQQHRELDAKYSLQHRGFAADCQQGKQRIIICKVAMVVHLSCIFFFRF